MLLLPLILLLARFFFLQFIKIGLRNIIVYFIKVIKIVHKINVKCIKKLFLYKYNKN